MEDPTAKRNEFLAYLRRHEAAYLAAVRGMKPLRYHFMMGVSHRALRRANPKMGAK